MISYIDCPAALERLEPFLDGELEVAEQVALEWHLQWCRTCVARIEDLQVIGASVRTMAPSQACEDDVASLVFVRDCVVTRARVEREAAWSAWIGAALRERRLLWPAAGASAAVVVCLVMMAGILHLSTLRTPDSLAGMIEVLANPGSNANPLRPGGHVSVPRSLGDAAMLDSIPDERVQVALAAVVTRDGRIAGYELLEQTRARTRLRQAAAWTDDMDALLDAVGRARFAPAQAAGDPVAVNLIWLLERTTVKSSVSANMQGVVVPLVSPLEEPEVAPLGTEFEPQAGTVSTTA